MKYLYLLLSLLFYAIPSLSLRIILPLYLYPGDSASAWNGVTSIIASHPEVQWLVIVNPNSGPGTTASSPTDPSIISGIAKLNSYANVQTIGYVLTGHGSRDKAAITADVDTYAKWTGDIKLGGIYFDEASAEPTNEMYDFYQSIAEHARSSIPSAHIAFNPGTIAPTQYFSYCDTMVEFEASLGDYQSQDPVQKIPEEFRPKSALQIYSTPEGTDVAGLVDTMVAEAVGAVYMGVDCCYKVFSEGLLGKLADAVGGGKM